MTDIVQKEQTRSVFFPEERSTGMLGLLSNQFSRQRFSLQKPLNMGLVAEKAAERFGNDTALYLDKPFDWDPLERLELSYNDVAALVERISAALAATGAGRWDRVAVLKAPNYDVNCIGWGAARIGAIPALIAPGLDSAVIRVLLQRLEAKVLVSDDDTLKKHGLDSEFLAALGCTVLGNVDQDVGVPISDVWDHPTPAPSPLKDDEPMLITHTSSTTGISKMAEACALGVSASAQLESLFPYAHGRKELFASVIAHVHVRGTITQIASFSRGTPVLGISTEDPETIRDLFVRYRPTIVEAHPNAFVAWEPLVDDPAEPFRTIRLFFNTFDAIHPRTVNRLLEGSQRRFPLWLQNYGMTETQAVTVRPYSRRLFPMTSENSRSVGWPVPRVRVRITDPADGETKRPTGVPGMIQVKTPARALSFVGTPEKFSERRHGKWFDTGDWGAKDRLGRVDILDRIADRIDGVDSCLQVEDVLLDRIPNAEEVVIVPDGEGKPVPVICLRDGANLDTIDWDDVVIDLPDMREPVVIDRASLSRTATVKARRFALTELVSSPSGDGPPQELSYPEGA